MTRDARPELAEALGAFLLVFAGGAAILADGTALAVALAFAFVITVLVSSLGHVSGAHFNPAITVAFAASGHFPWRRVAAYIAAQCLGALAAAAALRVLLGDVAAVATRVQPGLGLAEAAAVEAIASFLLAFVILAVATDRRAAQGIAGLAIGLTVGLNSLWAGPLTGAGTNPARSLGPAVLAATWGHLWLYLLVPVAGAVLGMLAYEGLRPGSKPTHAPGSEAMGALGPVRLGEAEP